MGIVFARIGSFSVFILFILAGRVASRHFDYEDAELLSDGVSSGRVQKSFVHLKEMDSSEKHCQQMYGFLPCATNGPSQFFLIVIYEYLLYQGEYYASGHGRVFRVFGESFWAAFFSQLLDSLPESLILLASGLMSNEEKAQDYVLMGVGLLAGSSILLLTVLWGICFICARTEFDVEPHHEQRNQGTLLLTDAEISYHAKIMFLVLQLKNKVVQLLTGAGVVTDNETTYHAFKMLLSLLPFIYTLLVNLIISNFGEGYNSVHILVLLLLARFFFTYFRSQRNLGGLDSRVEYAQVERKVEMNVPFYEVQALIRDREKDLTVKQIEMEEFLKHPVPNDDKTMNKEEFLAMFRKWIDETRNLMDDPYSNDQSGTTYNHVAELLLEDKNKMIELISYMMEFSLGEKLHIQDGVPDESSIDRFFKRIDSNDDKLITRLELKNYIMELNLDEIQMEGEMPTKDEIIEIIMKRLDIDGSGDINETEFKYGVKKWLKGINVVTHNQQRLAQNNNHEIDEHQRGEAKAKAQKKEKKKAVTLLIGGIIMLMGFAEPLVESVQQFSETVNIQPFYVSFCFVPLATNARTAIAAIKSASHRSQQTTTLTFSEIYHKVFMNNILGLFVLVSVIYFRGLTWHFSVEILVVVIVCSIMGLLTLLSKFQNWTMLLAFLLYPLSLAMVYFFADTFHFA